MIIKRSSVYTPKGKERMLHIYLPDDYDTSTNRYPVMYFFDGHNLFYDTDATYGKSWGLKDFLDQWEKQMIIVVIECGHEGSERMSEYCPYDFRSSYWGDVTGTGDDCMQWIVDEIKPMIDREYRTYSFREATAIGGSSMGGLMSLFAVVKYNDVFSKAACVSSAIGFARFQMMNDIKRYPIEEDTKVYLSWGTEEAHGKDDFPVMETYTAKMNLEANHLLQLKGAQTFVYVQEGGHHCEADWEKQVPEFMHDLWYL